MTQVYPTYQHGYHFHDRLNKTEEALHFKIGENTSKPRLKLHFPQDIFLEVHKDQSVHL